MVKSYDDFSASTKLESFVDYSKIKESTISKISNLTEKETIEDTEDIEDKENEIFFKGCMYGMLVAFAIMLFIMNFIKEMI
ncbi:hypothetical protein [Parvimonas sp. D9]|jgi:hypothetical protein|uniref:hypothetical protein n=1 Tax=Parvimonas sp. D9 TaxID=3110689 RepID=UPI002B4A6733|nr:hypothetical protein [Parvimonas sp. D9]MEB3059217.1 hypothetical protein [Parvimonas sp. D9]